MISSSQTSKAKLKLRNDHIYNSGDAWLKSGEISCVVAAEKFPQVDVISHYLKY